MSMPERSFLRLLRDLVHSDRGDAVVRHMLKELLNEPTVGHRRDDDVKEEAALAGEAMRSYDDCYQGTDDTGGTVRMLYVVVRVLLAILRRIS
jgi:hypothetical protein